MKSSILAIWPLYLLIRLTNGLECYNCVYSEGIPADYLGNITDILIDKSCDNDAMPKITFLETCDDGNGTFNVACGKLNLTGSMAFSIDGPRKAFKLTERGCIQTSKEKPEKCFHAQSPKEFVQNPDVPGELNFRFDFTALYHTTKVSACLCNSEKCNCEKCNSSSMLRLSHNLYIIFSFALFAYKIFGLG